MKKYFPHSIDTLTKYIFILSTLLSCETKSKNEIANEGSTQDTSIIITDENAQEKTTSFPILEYQQKDSLVFSWVKYFENYIIDSSKNTKTYELTKNKYNSDQIDTIIKIKSEHSLIKTYKVKQKKILDNSYINDNSIILPNNLLIGQDRNEVFSNLNLEFSNDTLELGDMEGNSRFKLIFEDESLKSFVYCSYLE